MWYSAHHAHNPQPETHSKAHPSRGICCKSPHGMHPSTHSSSGIRPAHLQAKEPLLSTKLNEITAGPGPESNGAVMVYWLFEKELFDFRQRRVNSSVRSHLISFPAARWVRSNLGTKLCSIALCLSRISLAAQEHLKTAPTHSWGSANGSWSSTRLAGKEIPALPASCWQFAQYKSWI